TISPRVIGGRSRARFSAVPACAPAGKAGGGAGHKRAATGGARRDLPGDERGQHARAARDLLDDQGGGPLVESEAAPLRTGERPENAELGERRDQIGRVAGGEGAPRRRWD